MPASLDAPPVPTTAATNDGAPPLTAYCRSCIPKSAERQADFQIPVAEMRQLWVAS